jgi:NADH-quinone oxidoreductase subunit L
MMIAPELIAVFAPIIGFVVVGMLGRRMGDDASQLITCALMVAAALSSVYLFHDVILNGHSRTLHLATWIAAGDFNVSWALRIDQLAVVMMCVINIVSCCVHIYSVGYMSHDHSIPRFMAYLSLFTFAMLMLVTADNLVQIFFGWEGVGLASYLLIGFWFEKPSANAASIKAFIVNRVGDLGLTLGILTTFMVFGSVTFDTIFVAVPDKANVVFNFLGYPVHALTLIGLLLFVGAVGKSAQLGLHTWLPDAMEGPTPVSALIHAATMVTAGVFLIARFSPLYEYAPDALMVVCIMGAATAFVAATIGLTQNDIKRVIAYSTMSQLGYMFFALGVSAYGAAMFHLVTHAFFKALLFLGAGSVIHAMSGEQDMRKMGGIWKKIPFTHAMMLVGSLALCGVPLLAGYYSKDTILEAAWAAGTWQGQMAYGLGVAAAFMTAFYSWRLMCLTFYGKTRADHHTFDHVHESPWSMKAPLLVLAIGAVFSGAYFYGGMVDGYKHHAGAEHTEHHEAAKYIALTPDKFQDWTRETFWRDSLKVLPAHDSVAAAHGVEDWVRLTPTIVAGAGMILALLIYLLLPRFPAKFAGAVRPLYNLSYRKWYFDELYDIVFVRSARALGRLFWKTGDGAIIDGCGPDAMAKLTTLGAAGLSRLQTGYVYHYAFVMMGGVIAMITWLAFKIGLIG